MGNDQARCGAGEKSEVIYMKEPEIYLLPLGEIPDFGKKISTVRSRGIATTIIFQAITQMQNRYPNGLWEEILAACDTSLFLGCNDETSAKYYSEKTGISTIEVGTEQRSLKTLRITDYTPEVRQSEGEGKRYVKNPDELQRFKYQDELIFCKGFNVFQCNKFDYELHPEAKKLEYEKAIEHIPEWRKMEEPYHLYVLCFIPGTEEFDRKKFPGGKSEEEDEKSGNDSGTRKSSGRGSTAKVAKPKKGSSKKSSSWNKLKQNKMPYLEDEEKQEVDQEKVLEIAPTFDHGEEESDEVMDANSASYESSEVEDDAEVKDFGNIGDDMKGLL